MLPTLKQNTESNDYCYVMLDDCDAISQVFCSINKKKQRSYNNNNNDNNNNNKSFLTFYKTTQQQYFGLQTWKIQGILLCLYEWIVDVKNSKSISRLNVLSLGYQ